MLTTENRNDRWLYVFISIIYLLLWIVKYNELTQLAYVVSIIVLLLQLKSLKWATYIYLLIIFIPFLSGDFLGTGPLRLNRVAFIPFLLYGLRAPKLHKFHFNKILFLLLIASFLLIRASSDYQRLVQFPDWTLENSLAAWFDLISYIIFFYIVFTRFNTKDLQLIFNFMLFMALLEGVTLGYLIQKNPDLLYSYGESSILWENPYFGHKNFWGVFYAFIALIALSYISYKEPDNLKSILIIVLVISSALMLLSLSRRALLIFLIGVFYLSFAKKKHNTLIFSGFFLIIILLLDFDFLANRYSSLLNVRSLSDLQSASSGQLRDIAIRQFIDYFDFVPQMFVRKWEYNWSESFWTGLLYQLGIFGMLFNIGVLFFTYRRYKQFSTSADNKIKNNSILIMMFCIIFLVGGFGLTSMYFIDYYGSLRQTGILVLFLIYQNELLINKSENAYFPTS